MKSLSYLFTNTLLIVFLSGQVQPERLYQIPEITDDMLARIDLKDGSVKDWEEVLGEPTLRPLDFVTPPELNYDPSSLDFRIWLTWHDATDKLFLAAEFVDDIFLSDYDRYASSLPPFTDSSVWFYVDGDNSGGDFHVVHSGEEMQHAQIYTAFAQTYLNDSNVTLIGISSTAAWVHKPPFADGGGAVVDSNPIFSVVEFYVTPFDRLIPEDPELSVVSDLFPGKKIRIELDIVDEDTDLEDGISDNSFFLIGDWQRLLTSDVWAEAVLSGADQAPPNSTTVVTNHTLGQIKKDMSKSSVSKGNDP